MTKHFCDICHQPDTHFNKEEKWSTTLGHLKTIHLEIKFSTNNHMDWDICYACRERAVLALAEDLKTMGAK